MKNKSKATHCLQDENGNANRSMIAAYAALTGDTVNIADAYTAEGFDFSGTRAFDKKTGYRSTSFLTIPMRDHENEVIGVLQLLNRIDPASGRSPSSPTPTSAWPAAWPRRRPSR